MPPHVGGEVGDLMAVRIGTSAGVKDLLDPKVGTSAGRKDVQEIWLGQGGTKKLVWVRQALTVTAAATRWDQVTLTTSPPGSGVDSYVIRRNGVVVTSPAPPAGTGSVLTPFTWTDTTLLPSTACTYVVEAVRAGIETRTATSNAVTTAARRDMGLTATATAWNNIALAWSDPDGQGVDRYDLYRNDALFWQGAGKAVNDGVSGGFTYRLRAHRGGVFLPPEDSAHAATPARPTSSAIAYGPACCSGYAWAQSTAKHLGGPNFTLSGGGTNYVSGFNCRINGYGGSTGRFSPHIGGHTYDWQYPAGTGAGDVRWSDVAGGDRALGNGVHGTYVDTGGNGSYRSQWQAWSGGSYSSQISWGQVNYWWHSALLADRELLDAGLADRDILQTTLNDWEGRIVARRVCDKLTGERLFEGGDLAALEARIADDRAGC